MAKLLKFELTKLHKSVTFWVCLAVFAVLVAGSGTVTNILFSSIDSTQIEWTQEQIDKQKAQMTDEEFAEFEAQLEWQQNGSAIQHIDTSDSEQAKFVAANNVNEEVGIPTFTQNAFESTWVLVIFLSVVVAMLLAQEFTSGTIKLSLMSGHRRDEIVTSKALTAVIATIEMIAATALLCLAFAIVYFLVSGTPNPEPWGALKLTSRGGAYAVIPAWLKFLFQALLSVLEGTLFTSFAFFVSMLTRNTPLTIVLPIVFSFIPKVVTSDKLTNNVIWKHLFFNLQDNFMLMSSPDKTLWTAVLASLIWIVVFLGASFLVFEKKDVYS